MVAISHQSVGEQLAAPVLPDRRGRLSYPPRRTGGASSAPTEPKLATHRSPLATVLAVLALLGSHVRILPAQAAIEDDHVVRSGGLISIEHHGLRWSPDGTRIVFVERRYLGKEVGHQTLWVLDMVNMRTGSVSPPGRATDPAWSPDGTRLAYILYDPSDPDHGDVVIADADGSNARHVTVTGDFFRPAWIGSESNSVGVLRAVAGGDAITRTAICTLEINSGEVTELRSWPVAQAPYDIQWSPSGKKVFYWGRGPARPVGGIYERPIEAFVLDAQTGHETPMVLPPDTNWIERISWSPDEKWLAAEVLAGARESGLRIWLLPAGEGEARPLDTGARAGNFYLPAWALGGQGVLCVWVPPIDPAAATPRVPRFLLAAADGSDCVELEPDWPSAVSPWEETEVAVSPAGKIAVVASAGELRFLELGTKDEYERILTQDRMKILGRALMEWATQRSGRLPSPRDVPGAREDDPYFWVPLVRPLVRPETFYSPADTERSDPSSFNYPPEAYRLNATVSSPDMDKIILVEKAGLHPGGHFVLHMDGSTEWVEDARGEG